MQFRDADEKDFEACLPLLRQLWPNLKIDDTAVETQVVQEIKSVFRRLLKKLDAKVIVIEEEGQIITLIDLTFRETLFYRDWAIITEDLIVDEAHQRKGIGTQLVRLAEEIAQQRGCRGIELNSDLYREETHRFWEALGYKCKAYQFRKNLMGLSKTTEPEVERT